MQRFEWEYTKTHRHIQTVMKPRVTLCTPTYMVATIIIPDYISGSSALYTGIDNIITSGNVKHCWRAGATQLGICPRCSAWYRSLPSLLPCQLPGGQRQTSWKRKVRTVLLTCSPFWHMHVTATGTCSYFLFTKGKLCADGTLCSPSIADKSQVGSLPLANNVQHF